MARTSRKEKMPSWSLTIISQDVQLFTWGEEGKTGIKSGKVFNASITPGSGWLFHQRGNRKRPHVRHKRKFQNGDPHRRERDNTGEKGRG